MTWGSPDALRSGASGSLSVERSLRGEQEDDEPPPAARPPSRAVSRCNRSLLSDPLAKDGVKYPGAKRPRRLRGVEYDAGRNQNS